MSVARSINILVEAKEEAAQMVTAYHDSTELYGGYPPTSVWLPGYLVVAYMGYGDGHEVAVYRWSDLITIWYESRMLVEDTPYGDSQIDEIFGELLSSIEVETEQGI